MGCLRVAELLLCLAVALLGADPAETLFRAGQSAERAGDRLQAYLLYSRAASLAPGNAAYAQRRMALEASTALVRPAQSGPDPADETIGTAVLAQTPDGVDLWEAQRAAPPPRLVGSSVRKNFDLKGDARTVFESVASAYGLVAIFEDGYQSPPPLVFRVNDVDYEEALHALEAASDSFIVPLGDRVALVARDTVPKRAAMSPNMSIAIPIPSRISAQEAQEIVTGVQQTLDLRRISVDPLRRVIYIRDQVAKVRAAQALLANLAQLRAQVEIEVQFLSVARNSTLGYGLSLPNSSAILDFGTAFHNAVSGSFSASQFLTFGGGATLLGLGIGDAAALATLSQSSTQTLLEAQIVTLDGQAATLHVGDHYPVIATGYYGTTTGSGQVFAPPPTINFEDLGLVLKVTPSVHAGNEVTLHLDAEFKTLGGSSVNGIPVIDSRQFQGDVRLGGGEWAVIAGLASASDAHTRSGIAGLAAVPGLGSLMSQNSRVQASSQTLIVLKPRITVVPPWETVAKPIWVGSESRPVTQF